jgi:hypothetical protein
MKKLLLFSMALASCSILCDAPIQANNKWKKDLNETLQNTSSFRICYNRVYSGVKPLKIKDEEIDNTIAQMETNLYIPCCIKDEYLNPGISFVVGIDGEEATINDDGIIIISDKTKDYIINSNIAYKYLWYLNTYCHDLLEHHYKASQLTSLRLKNQAAELKAQIQEIKDKWQLNDLDVDKELKKTIDLLTELVLK